MSLFQIMSFTRVIRQTFAIKASLLLNRILPIKILIVAEAEADRTGRQYKSIL